MAFGCEKDICGFVCASGRNLDIGDLGAVLYDRTLLLFLFFTINALLEVSDMNVE